MIKKLALLLGIAIFFVACGSQQTVKKDEGTATVAASGDVVKQLAGEWEAEELGAVLAQYGFALPAKFTFTEDGKYVWEFTKGGALFVAEGKYVLVDASSKPYKIDFIQEKTGKKGEALAEVKMESAGIFDFEGGKLKTIFYNKKFLPRPEEFGDNDTQWYKKVK
ncbi:MAG TPA: hypothetical protein PKW55_08495 [Spirochaetota bacterium]|nr:hypothetical protein [Spirochaetota bacterium]HOM39133.1 hypothetical protein [Spirochaetota bacterium]HPQ50016.1 hypothetical protein [Spirochaetota bacterium]